MNAHVHLPVSQTTARFPMTPYPRGWYHVAYSDELRRREVRTLRYFGRELVLARTARGEAMLTDPHCPHLGAHLGHGGTVRGESIVCPFHGWEFGSDGRCAKIPYDPRIPHKAQLATWHVREHDGAVYAWFDRHGGAPTHEPPRLPTFDGRPLRRFTKKRGWVVRTHVQEITENGLDSAHFETVHKLGLPARSECSSPDAQPFELRQEYDAPYFGLSAKLTVRLHEPGVHHTLTELGDVGAFVLSTLTPVDEEHVHHRFSFLAKPSKLPLVGRVLTEFLMREAARQYEQDIPIWENKKYLDRP
ncbi:MAG: aromatic ring-hydroxylating dioxygenase subunit alpha, partial [Polyangiaceae bacterium]|nr:aromatic ring-hydroxylating dioxygenase subunit alpha [Polyangiaceae bacterium]